MGEIEIATPHGPARVHLNPRDNAKGTLVMGHGAGGGFGAPDLTIVAEVAAEAGFTVALIEQPYRVAGRKAPAPAKQLDAAWTAVVDALRQAGIAEPLVCGGRSSGARVACRTALATGASAVLCLAFPVHPPGKAGDPAKSRLPELDAVGVPVLVVQGESDPFGMAPDAVGREVVRIRGNHSLRSDAEALRAALASWLGGLAGGGV